MKRSTDNSVKEMTGLACDCVCGQKERSRVASTVDVAVKFRIISIQSNLQLSIFHSSILVAPA